MAYTNIGLPWHRLPSESSVKPGSQIHAYVPLVLLQFAFSPHECVAAMHSSISAKHNTTRAIEW